MCTNENYSTCTRKYMQCTLCKLHSLSVDEVVQTLHITKGGEGGLDYGQQDWYLLICGSNTRVLTWEMVADEGVVCAEEGVSAAACLGIFSLFFDDSSSSSSSDHTQEPSSSLWRWPLEPGTLRTCVRVCVCVCVCVRVCTWYTSSGN